MSRFWVLIYVSVLLALIPVVANGQDEAGGLFVSGKITTEQGNVGGAVIKLFKNGKAMPDYQVEESGRFNLRFEFNNEYVLVFMRTDNFPQKYTISTTVPSDVLRRDRKFPPFPLDVNLFTEVKGVDRSFSENTVLRIFYSASVDNFISETYYNNAQIKKLIEQAITQSQNVSREADLLKRLSNAELTALKKEYNELLKQAGDEFDKGEYAPALSNYKKASRIFPSEQFPKDRIAEINDLIAILGLEEELARQEEAKYNQFIQQGDKLFDEKAYPGARQSYESALLVRPDDAYATGRISEIEQLMALMDARQKYDEIIAQADKSFADKEWDSSKKQYQEALKILPQEQYPVDQIAKIDGELQQLAQAAEQRAAFDAALRSGDTSFNRKEYPKAMEFYQIALSIIPDDPTALEKARVTEKMLQAITDRKLYNEHIANADKSYKQKEYENARNLYVAALELMPEEKYPQQQIEAIDKVFAQFKEYDQLIAEADTNFDEKEYNKAKDTYKQAQAIKPAENYPAQKIKEIDAILAELAKAESQYKQIIANADRHFNAQRMPDAKAEYRKAQAVKPDEPYPAEMLQKIDEWEAEQIRLAEQKELEAQKEADEKYKAIIAEADKLLADVSLVEASSKYMEALIVKPKETYPLEKLEEIKRIFFQKEKQFDDEYDDAIAAADKAFEIKDYENARANYRKALEIKANETYPAEQLVKIDKQETEEIKLAAEESAKRAAMEEKDRLYAEAIAEADGRFVEKLYSEAIASYKKALQVKPDESYPKERIAESERLIREAADAQKAYNTAIAAADKAFGQKKYDAAKTGYREAQTIKPEETYPPEQLVKIEAIEAEEARLAAEKSAAEEAARLAAMNEKDRQYTEAIAEADGRFDEKLYSEAIASYKKASQVKPDESYPKERIAESERLIREAADAQKAYNTAIAAADKAFGQKKYDVAKTGYREAQIIKPEETYPPEQLAKIEAIEAEEARLAAEKSAEEEAAKSAATAKIDKQYADAIAEADDFFDKQEYSKAISGYRKALKIKADEIYPKDQIAQSEKLQMELAAMNKTEKEYLKLISQADRSFSAQNYKPADKNYRLALELKPDEEHPRIRIQEIEVILKKQEIDGQYKNLLLAADKFFRAEEWHPARSGYVDALEVKPNEAYPQKQIDKIDETLRKIADREALAALAEANRNAPKEAEPTKEIDYAIKRNVNTDDAMYANYIELGDNNFDEKAYNVSRGWYNKALEVKPGEAYPRQRISEIGRLLSELQLSQREKEYQEFIKSADDALQNNQLSVARGWYNKALSAKPNDSYTKTRLAEIQKIVTTRLQGSSEQIFDGYMQEGDKALEQNNYNVARVWYKRAQEIKPTNETVKQKLETVQKMQAGTE